LGRIKTKKIKRITREVMKVHGDLVQENFNDNKELMKEKITVSSKKIRNIISGYATRLKKSIEKL
jgi:ribosomal protein S17E